MNLRAVVAIGLLSVVSAGLVHAVGQTVDPGLYGEMHWRNIGPFRGGRTRAAAGVPGRPNVFFAGVVNGGVWKTDDYGRTWTPIFDQEATQSIGAIAVAPSDPSILYVASGEGLQRPDLSVGDGIYRSTDGGKSWTHLGLRDGQQIPALAVDPRNAQRLFAAVLGHPYGANSERGIFLSQDGGATWKKVLYVDENTGGSDVQLDPSNPDVVYASMWEVRQGPWEFGNEYSGAHGGLFVSRDGGATWHKLTHGLPPDLSQIYVAPAPSNPHRLYATTATATALGIYRSDDGGESWARATTDARPAMRIGGGDLPVPKVDPKNADIVYSASVVTWRSEDGARTWTGVKGAPGGDDYQNIWINPEHPYIILLVGDQGAAVSVNRGRTWSSWYNQPTAQLYHVSADNSFPYRVCGGQQESGSVCISSRGNDGAITFREWHPVGVIEYGYAAPDPLNNDIVYGAGRGEVSKFHWSTGQVEMVTPSPLRDDKYRADRTQPILFSPVNPHRLFYAANVVFESTDGAQTWHEISPDLTRPHSGVPASLGSMAAKDARADSQRGVVYALAPSFHNESTLWAGTDDGLVWVTHDAGRNWTNVTPPELTPWSKVTQIEASHSDEQSAYASVSRFRVDDLRPYIYRTHDGGKTWRAIVGGLPRNAPVNTVREDPATPGLLYAGTENGVWVSFDDGDRWQPLQMNLPHTSVRDLWIHEDDLIAATHGRSFWILDDVSPLRQARSAAAAKRPWLFRPASAWRVRRDTNTDTPLPPDEPLGENPPDGAIIDYWLPEPASDPVTLEIADASGKLVRRYSSADALEMSAGDERILAIPSWWVSKPMGLQVGAGMHRWVWDLHYAAPDSLRHEYPISAVPGRTPRLPQGPLALPGVYTVTMTVAGNRYTAPLRVKPDPRVKISAADLQKQFTMERELAEMMTAATRALREARSVEAQLDKLSKPSDGGLGSQIEGFRRAAQEFAGGGGRFGQRAGAEATLGGTNGQVSSLYSEVGNADAAPNAAQAAAFEVLSRRQAQVMARWEQWKSRDLPPMNERLRKAGLPEIRLDASPAVGEEMEGSDLE